MQAEHHASHPENVTTKKVPLTTSFANENKESLYQRLLRYTAKAGMNKPQDVVRLAVSKFLEKEGY